MGRKNGYGPMIDRVQRSRSVPDVPTPLPPPPDVRHCWVTDQHGRRAGLLLRWERREAGWVGRVSYPAPDGDGWALVEEWLPAEMLQPATPAVEPG